MTKKLLIISVLLIIGGSGYWLYGFFQRGGFFPRQPVPILTSTPTPSPTGSASPDETLGWKIYSDYDISGNSARYQNPPSYEIKYPPEWEYTSGADYWLGHVVSTLEPFWLSIRVFDNPDKLSSKQWADKTLSENKKAAGPDGSGVIAGGMPDISTAIRYKETRELTIAGLPAYELYGVMAYDRSDEQIYLAKDDKLFYFNFPVADKNPNLADPAGNNKKAWQVVNSFKFLK